MSVKCRFELLFGLDISIFCDAKEDGIGTNANRNVCDREGLSRLHAGKGYRRTWKHLYDKDSFGR